MSDLDIDLGFEPEEDLGFEPDLRAQNTEAARKALAPAKIPLTKAMGMGGFQGASAEWGDELEAMRRSGATQGPQYEAAKARRRQELEDAADQHPIGYHGAKVAGLLSAGIAAGPGVAGAAALGGLTGGGLSEADPREDPVGFGLETGFGAAFGGATQGVFNKVARTFSPSNLKETAVVRANKAATGENRAAIKSEMAKAPRDEAGQLIPEALQDQTEMIGGRLGRRGEDLLQRDEAGPAVVQAGDKWTDIFPKAAKKRDFFGQKISQTIQAADEAGVTVDGRAVAQRMYALVDDLPENEQTRPVIQRVLAQASEFENAGQIPMSIAQKHKESFVWNKAMLQTMPRQKEITNGMNRAISDSMEEAMEMAAVQARGTPQGELFEGYRRSKSKFDSFNSVADAAQEQRGREVARNIASPSDKGIRFGGLAAAGTTALSTGRLDAAAAIAISTVGLEALNRLARQRGSSVTARTAYTAYRVMNKLNELPTKYAAPLLDAAQRGGREFMLTDALLKKTYPDYSAIMGAAAE